MHLLVELRKDYLQGYLLRKLRDMEAARQKAGRVPTQVTLPEYHDSIMDDMREAIAALNDHGIVEMGPTLNSMYLQINPENAEE